MKLSKRQEKIVTSKINVPTLVIAGPGSGKTRVLVERIKHVVDSGIKPGAVLAFTFSKKAADEMQRRLKEYGKKYASVNFGTFHKICLSILRDNGYNQEIMRTYDRKVLLETLSRDLRWNISWKLLSSWNSYLQLNYENWNDRRIAANNILSETFTGYSLDFQTNNLINLLQKFEEQKNILGLIDFDDMLTIANRKILIDSNDYSMYKKDYILIDEQQDTNTISFEIARKLMKKNGLFAVGDPDQAIFTFNGSNPDNNIFKFHEYFPKHKLYKLERNYRSTEEIVKLVDKVIVNNYEDLDSSFRKNMKWSKKKMGGIPVLYGSFEDEDEEAESITRSIEKLMSNGDIDYKDIFVIYRTNAQSRAIEDSFAENDIPYSVRNSNGFYNRKDIKNVLSYIKLAMDTGDNESFEAICNIASAKYPTYHRSLGKAFINDCRSKNRNLLDGAIELANTLKWNNYKINAIKDILYVLEQIETALKENKAHPGELIKLVRSLCYDSYLIRSEGGFEEEGEDRLKDMEQLQFAASKFKNIDDFFKHVKKMQKKHEAKENKAVVLTTVHRAKGLERKVVFGIGFSEGILPHARSLGYGGNSAIPSPHHQSVKDERCIAFVLCSRPEEYLFISYPMSYNNKEVEPSRFLVEMGLVDPLDNTEILMEHENIK